MIITVKEWPRPKGYSNATAAQGRVIFVSGQIGWDPTTERIVSDDFVAQVQQALTNIAAVLKAAGVTTGAVTRLTWYLTDRAEYLARQAEIGVVYRHIFGAHYPAMSAVVVAGLVEAGAKVEIEATAVA